MLSHRSLIESLFILVFFLLYVQLQCFPLICFPSHWSSVLSNLLLIPSNLFLISVTLHFYLVLFYIFCFLKNFSFSFCSSNLFPSSLNIFVIITFMNHLLDRLHISTSLSPFSVVLSSLFWKYASVASFCLIFYFYFYVLDELFTFPTSAVAFCRWCSVCYSNTLPSGHQTYIFRCSSYVGGVGPSILAG